MITKFWTPRRAATDPATITIRMFLDHRVPSSATTVPVSIRIHRRDQTQVCAVIQTGASRS